jgi:hypothetical protein
MSFICNPTSVSDITKKVKEAKEADIAIGFAGTGIPLLDSLINDLTKALGALSSAGMSSALTAADAALKEVVGSAASGAIAAITAVLSIEAEGQVASIGMMFDSLERQVRLRQILLEEVIFHVTGIMNILNRLTRVQTDNFDTSLRRAYPYILAAYRAIEIIRKSMTAAKPRYSIALLRRAVYNMDIAIGILTGDTSRALGKKFFKDIVEKKTSPNQAFKDFIFKSVLEEYVVMAEVYIWHLTNLATVVVGGYASVGFGVIDMTSGYTIPGVGSSINTLLKQRQQHLNNLKLGWNKSLSSSRKTNGALRSLAKLDANKGLTLTHEAIKIQVALAKTCKTDWSTLTASAKALWISLNPAYGILKDIKEKVEVQIQKTGDGSLVNAGYTRVIAEPLLFRSWVASGLEAAKQLLLTNEAAGQGFQNIAEDLALIDRILSYLNSTQYQTYSEEGIDTVLKLMSSAAAFAITGPLNRRILQRGLVLFNEMQLLTRRALAEDRYLLSLLEQLDILNNPATAAILKMLSGIAAQSSLGGTIIKKIINGNFVDVASMLSSITVAIAGGVGIVTDIFKKLTGGCENDNSTMGYINAKADEAMTINENQVIKAAESAENKINPVPQFAILGGVPTSESII